MLTIRTFVKLGLINSTCIINLISILLITNHWFPLEPTPFKIVVFTLIAFGILSTILMSIIKNNSLLCDKIVSILYVASWVIFFICAISAHANISRFTLERGSDLYDKYSLPALLPAISCGILSVLKG